MLTKIKTKFILIETNKTLFEIEGYLYNTKKNKSFYHEYFMKPQKYKIKKVEDRVNEVSLCREVYIESCKKSTIKKS